MCKRFLVIGFVTFFSVHGFAQNEGKLIQLKAVSDRSIEYKINPFLHDCRKILNNSPIQSGRIRIEALADQTGYRVSAALKISPGSKAYLLPLIKYKPPVEGATVQKMNLGEDKIPLEPDSQGVLNITLQLQDNEGLIRFPLVLETDQFEDIYDITVAAREGEESRAYLVPRITKDKLGQLCIRNQVWAGLGASVFSYLQNIPALAAEAKFTSLNAGSFSAEAKYFPSPDIGIVGLIKSAPGEVKPGAVSSVSATNFRWNIVAAEAQYRPFRWSIDWREFVIYPFLKAGLQNHMIPRISIDAQNVVSIETIESLNASVGAGFNILDRTQYFAEMYMNYQIPVSVKSYKLTPKLIFDGSVGAGKMIGKNLSLGLFWYGQAHQFDYANPSGLDTNPGSINFIFSNVDLRLGWVF